MESYKPEGYPSVSPYLMVDDAAGTIGFLVDAFDAVELRRITTDDGKIMHAEVRIEDSVVMLADVPSHRPPTESHVHVYVRDVDGVYLRALAAGGTSVQAPVKKADEDRRGGVQDPGGTAWWISTRVG